MNKEILMQFCAADDTRPFLSNPFSDDTHTYATNGHMCIMVDKIDGFAETPQYVKTLKKAIEENRNNNLIKLTNLPEFLFEVCKNCAGTGRLRECCYCDGDGYLECDLGYEHECEDCDGSGKIQGEGDFPCKVCKATGKCYEIIKFKVGEVDINLRYAHLINSLPNAEISEIKEKNYTSAIYFKFDGGEGALMPLR